MFQVICKPSHATIKLENHSGIQLNYHIETENKLDESFEIRPATATIPGQSIIELELISCPVVPGAFEKCLKLCIEHCMPTSIVVEGVAVVSQVYVTLPRQTFFENHPVELGYSAVQSLTCSSFEVFQVIRYIYIYILFFGFLIEETQW